MRDSYPIMPSDVPLQPNQLLVSETKTPYRVVESATEEEWFTVCREMGYSLTTHPFYYKVRCTDIEEKVRV